MKVLVIPGSLRPNSSSNQLIREMIRIAPASLSLEVFEGVGDLPHFNDPIDIPETVLMFLERIKSSDVVLICTPEYAFGIPGSLKNALDWTVSSGEFVNKPVSVVTASSSGEKGHAALLLVLTAISARVIQDATLLVPHIRAKLDDTGRIIDTTLETELRRVLSGIPH